VSLDLSDLQTDLHEWQRERFPDSGAEESLMGALEELGELAHATLKGKQGLEGERFSTGPEAEKDAIGDCVVFLMQYASSRGYDIEECIEAAAGEALAREYECECERHGER
jgi:NTP pyrophosphatase (non-canonical NTP hydrolase)